MGKLQLAMSKPACAWQRLAVVSETADVSIPLSFRVPDSYLPNIW